MISTPHWMLVQMHEFGKFTSSDGEPLKSYYSRFYKMMNELVKNQCDSQELKTVSYHKLYDILKQHQNVVNELRAERLARIANPLALVAQQQLLNVEQADKRDDTDDEPKDKELEAHYLYMAHIQEVTPDDADNSGPIFDVEPVQKVKNDDDNYNVFANDKEHPEQPESVNDTYLDEQGDTNITTDSLDMSNNRGEADQDDNDDLARECDLLASLIEKLKYFKNKNKCLESSNNHFKEANTELAKTNQLMFKDLKKFQAKLDRYHAVNYASKVEIDCAKAKGELISYKMCSEKSFNKYTRKINDLNQTILEIKKELIAHQETNSIISQEKEAQKKFYKTLEDKEIEKVIALENKVKVLDDIVYKAGYYNDNLALMLALESDKTIRLAQESRSKLSDLIKPVDYKNLNNLYDLFAPQREKSACHTPKRGLVGNTCPGA
ncbi:hypothetical protein Tco_0479119 [Tanacetum coccineum]